MNKINITTPQNVQIEYESATLLERAVAAFLDILFIGIISMLLIWGTYLTLQGLFVSDSIINGGTDDLTDSGYALFYLAWIFVLLIFILYPIFMEHLTSGQTLGKKIVGIRVIKADGSQLSIQDLFIRVVFGLFEIYSSSGTVALIVAGISENRQRIGDSVAGTVVIKNKSTQSIHLDRLLQMQEHHEGEQKYPEVRKLTEEQVMVIVDTIYQYRKYRTKKYSALITKVCQQIRLYMDLPKKGLTFNEQMQFLLEVIKEYRMQKA
ncbi:RDD family protein [Algivirga pacifica]|uniref:RDD family protein n=1 Tax=Algivirga pacifica TaxID=1162670 RepID=A0ABP9DF52_9BACT